MTQKDAYNRYERWYDLGFGHSTMPASEMLIMAMHALEPTSAETVESRWGRCSHCSDGTSVDGQIVMLGNKGWQPLNFCPICGAPITEEGTQIILKNLERLIAVKLEESNHD